MRTKKDLLLLANGQHEVNDIVPVDDSAQEVRFHFVKPYALELLYVV